MKIFNIRDFYHQKYQEYIIGSQQTGKHSLYLVYGEVPKGEVRVMAPDGHEEILFLLAGEAVVEKNGVETPLLKEQVLCMNPDETFALRAMIECRYIVAGTHITPHGH